MLRAYADESRRTNGALSVFVMVASIDMSETSDGYRTALTALLLEGKSKLHWYGAVNEHKEEVIDAIAAMDFIHCVVLRNMPPGESDERARAKCLERLVMELQALGCNHVDFESRTTKLDNADMKRINFLRMSKSLTSGLTAAHVAGKEDALLWIADAVAGAIGDAELYNDRTWREKIEHQLHVVFAL